MDYSVGSLADLISGSNTPNKPKVIKKEFIQTSHTGNAEEDTNIKNSMKVRNTTENSFVKGNKTKKGTKNRNDGEVKIERDFNKSIKIKKEHKLYDNKSTVESKNQKKHRKRKFSGPDTLKIEQDISESIKLKVEEHEVYDNKSIVESKNQPKKHRKRKFSEGADGSSLFKKQNLKNEQNDVSHIVKAEKKNKGGKRAPPEDNQLISDTEKQKKHSENGTIVEEGSPPKKQKLSKNEQNAEKRIKKKNKEKQVQDPEELARTIFVGNVPITCNKKKIKKHFKKYGEIDTVRIRGIPVADLKTPKKVAAIKKEFNPNRSNVFCYIRFVDKESAIKAEAENGLLFEDHHLRVHTCASEEKPDETRAIFVGNLSFNAAEDELWKLFESCGPISYVRIVRDSHSGMGKGFAYVNFMDSDAVQLALGMEDVKLNERVLRISLCNLNSARKNKKNNKNRKITQPGKQKMRSEFKKQSKPGAHEFQDKVKQVNTGFQGTKFGDKNKKRKVNKGLLQKKKLIKKIAPKPK